MIALFTAFFTALYTLAFVAVSVLARRGAEAAAGWATAGWRWWATSLGLLALGLWWVRPSSWVDLMAIEFLFVGWLALNAGVELRRPGGREGLAFGQAYIGLVVLMAFHLVAQDYVDGEHGVTPAFTWVLHELLGVFTLPWVAWLVPSSVGPDLVGALYAAATGTLLDSVLILTTLGLHGFAWLILAMAAPPRATLPAGGVTLLPRPRWATGVLLLLLLFGAMVDDPSSTPTERLAGRVVIAVLLPVYVVQGALIVHRLAGVLRTRKTLVVLLAASFPFLPFVLGLFFLLGLFDHLLGLSTRTEAPRVQPPAAATVLRGGLIGGLALGVLALPGALSNSGQGPPLETIPECTGVTSTDEGTRVRYHHPRGTFAIDKAERGPEPDARHPDAAPLDSAEAARRCKAAGARLCTSEEFDQACYCGYGYDAVSAHRAFKAHIVDGCFGGEAAGWVDSDCANRHGVQNLLGGRVELLSDRESSGASLIAGGTLFVGGGWNLYCGYRTRAVDGTLQRGEWPWVGYRCCTD